MPVFKSQTQHTSLVSLVLSSSTQIRTVRNRFVYHCKLLFAHFNRESVNTLDTQPGVRAQVPLRTTGYRLMLMKELVYSYTLETAPFLELRGLRKDIDAEERKKVGL